MIFTQPNNAGGINIGAQYDGSETMFFTFGEAGSPFINWDPSFGLVDASVVPANSPQNSDSSSVMVAAWTLASVAAVALL